VGLFYKAAEPTGARLVASSHRNKSTILLTVTRLTDNIFMISYNWKQFSAYLSAMHWCTVQIHHM